MDEELVCPNCGSGNVGTIEEIGGTSLTHGIVRGDDGEIEIRFTGYTEVAWDSSTSVGFQCLECFAEYREGDGPEQWAAALMTADEFERKQEEEDENGGSDG